MADLNGLELAGVCFVRNYVELDFDGPILRILSGPVVELGRHRLTHSEPGARDALCRMIGSVVAAATEDEASIRIAFEGGGVVTIPLESDDAGPEVAHFVPFADGVLNLAGMRIWVNRSE